MVINDAGPAYGGRYIRSSNSDIASLHSRAVGRHDLGETMMSDGGGSANSRLINSGLALDSAQSSYQRFKSIIDCYV